MDFGMIIQVDNITEQTIVKRHLKDNEIQVQTIEPKNNASTFIVVDYMKPIKNAVDFVRWNSDKVVTFDQWQKGFFNALYKVRFNALYTLLCIVRKRL